MEIFSLTKKKPPPPPPPVAAAVPATKVATVKVSNVNYPTKVFVYKYVNKAMCKRDSLLVFYFHCLFSFFFLFLLILRNEIEVQSRKRKIEKEPVDSRNSRWHVNENKRDSVAKDEERRLKTFSSSFFPDVLLKCVWELWARGRLCVCA